MGACVGGGLVRRKVRWGESEVTQQISSPVKKRWPLPVRRSRHKIKDSELEWEESGRRGNEGKH